MPTTYWEQPERVETETDGSHSITKSYKGNYADLVTLAGTLVIGTSTESGLPLKSVNIARTVGSPNLAVLRLEYGEETSYDSQKTATATSTNWNIKHTQRVVSLMRHTGDSASMPHRGNLEAWRKEADPALYDAFQYRAIGGSILTLSAAEQLVAAKLKAGVDGAMRFYPTVQKVTVYTAGTISGVGAGLAHVSTPGSPWDTAATSWLKVGDDVSLDAKAGTQTRTESWIGAASWDANLYGESPDRWTELDAG
jgi:hypothetical protein